MRQRLIWLATLSLLAGGVGFGIGALNDGASPSPQTGVASRSTDGSTSEPAGESAPVESVPVGAPEAPGLTDGRGNELIFFGYAPGGNFYCETEGLVEEGITEISLDSDIAEPRTPRELIANFLTNTVLSDRVDEVIGLVVVEMDSPSSDVNGSAVTVPVDLNDGLVADALLDSRLEGALDAIPGEVLPGSHYLHVALEDPNRSETTTAGRVRLALLPRSGWAVVSTSLCYSASQGVYPVPTPTPTELDEVIVIEEEG